MNSLSENVLIFFKLIFGVLFLTISEIVLGLFRFFIPRPKKNIKDQVVLITGGANGIGKSLAIELAKEKCKIAIADINYSAACKLVENLTKDFIIEAKAFEVDVSNYKELIKLREMIKESLGSVDILVNNAGIMCPHISLFEGSSHDIQRIIDVNLTSQLFAIKVFIKDMIDKKRGHIVGMSSMCGRTNFPLWITYSASKHGVSGMMYALNSDLNYLDLNFIKTTTIFPYLARTNQDVIKMLNTFKAKAASVSLEYLSKVAVEGILRDQNEIYIPSIAKYLLIEKFLPLKASLYMRCASRMFVKEESYDNRKKEILISLECESNEFI